MTTALDVIKRAMRLLGVYPSGEEPSPEEAQDALTTLNALLGEFSNGALVYVKTLDSIALTAGQSSVTVGPSGTTVTARPVRVLPESYIDLSGTSYPLEVFTLQQYNAIVEKDTQGIPEGLWVQTDMPDVTIKLWPVPSQAMTLKLWSDKVITSFPALTTVVSLPPGYKKLLTYLLAVEIAPDFEVDPPRTVLDGAARARRVLKRRNTQIPRLTVNIPGMGGAVDWRTA